MTTLARSILSRLAQPAGQGALVTQGAPGSGWGLASSDWTLTLARLLTTPSIPKADYARDWNARFTTTFGLCLSTSTWLDFGIPPMRAAATEKVELRE